MPASSAEVTEFQATAGNVGLIGGTAFLGALIGFVLQLLVAYYFGAGKETDAFFMAQSTSELLSKLLLGGSITAVFIPLFVDHLTHDRTQDAWNSALNIFHVMAAVYIVIIGLLLAFASPFVRFIAPGFDPATFALTVQLLYILLPSFFFLFLVEFATSMLQSLRRFALPALLRLVAPAVSIVAIVLLAPSLGILALAIGVVAGSIIQFGILAWGLKRAGLVYRFILQPRDPVIRDLLYLVYPFIFSVLTTQGAGIVYRMLVSNLTPGSLAALKFAEKITQLMAIMFLNSVTTVIFPLLSQKASRQDVSGMRETVASAVRLIVFVTVPLVVGVALLREPLISFLYQRGSFSQQDASMTSIALLFLVIGLTTNGISSVFGHTILAFKQTRTAVIVTIASQLVAISLFIFLVPLMGLAGLALASSLVPISAAAMYFFYLRRSIPRLRDIFYHTTYSKTAILAVLLAAAIITTHRFIPPSFPFTDLLLPTITGSITFFGGAYLWHINEMHQLLKLVKAKTKRFL